MKQGAVNQAGAAETASAVKWKNPAQLVNASGLPDELKTVVLTVARKCRLWNGERIGVARELCAHFADGLAAGRTPAQLIESFGDAKQTAKLMTRACKRKRSWVWKAWLRAWQAIGVLLLVLLVLYGYWAAQFWLRSPSIKRNYVAEMNAPVIAVPVEQRAWTHYRAALMKLPKIPLDVVPDGSNFPNLKPGDAAWAPAVKFVEQQQAQLELIRRAAKLEQMGYRLSSNGDPELTKAREPEYQPTAEDLREVENPEMFMILLPHLAHMRELARWFAFDARYAASTGDGARVAEDLQTLVAMARHSSQGAILINQLVGLAIMSLQTDLAREILTNHAQLLSERDLVALIHANAEWTPSGVRGASEQIDFSGEELFMEDFLQRYFSDDGNGNGRLTAKGTQAIRQMTLINGQPREDGLESALGPVISALSADRRSLSEHHRGSIRAMLAEANKPMWTRNFSKIEGEIAQRAGRGIANPYWISDVFVPALTKCFESNDMTLIRRDATVTVLAIELFKKRTGAYPSTLNELVPAYLPALPIDRWDGQPLRYLAKGTDYSNGKPVLYSIGRDKIDDRGAVLDWERPEDPSYPRPDFVPSPQKKSLGDWIFFPTIEAKKPAAPTPAPTGAPTEQPRS